MTTTDRPVRRGLPRTAGGPPWPVIAEPAVAALAAPVESAPVESVAAEAFAAPPTVAPPTAAVTALPEPAELAIAPSDGIRRGLPRVPGGAPWPVAIAAPILAPANDDLAQDPAVPIVAPAPSEAVVAGVVAAEAAAPAAPASSEVTPERTSSPAAAAPMPAPTPAPTPTPAPVRQRPQAVAAAAGPAAPLSPRQRVGVFVVCAFALFGLASAVVLAARWLVGLDPVAAFVARYPGEYELPHGAPTGLPAWLGWQHFFNLFFLVLIVRSGLQVRHQKRPPAYWASKRHPDRKVSLTLWLHQSLDVLWLTNGVVFVILLFVTGQWMRIVPTSWEVFPNALSAGLQYLTLNWPVENGWINYNGLQQLAYFLTVFIAAPLAVASGVRMSGFWPKDNARLNAAYPAPVARALHFPVMLYFVGFTVIHVTLVLTTGALRNLNHMYGARDEVSWYGAIMLLVSLAVIAGSVVAARPLVLAPIARMMGHVSAR